MVNDVVYKKIELIHPSKVGNITATRYNFEGNRLILHGERFMLVNRHSKVRLMGYCDDGVMEMHGKVTMSIPSQVNIDIDSIGKATDRRDSLKVRTDAEAIITGFYMPGRNNKKFSIRDNIRLRDISAGGVCFFSNNVYFVKQRLYIDLFDVAEQLKVDALLLRKKKEDRPGGHRYRYACKFVGVDPISERKLFEYAFKTELENHRKEQEKDLKIHD